MARKLTGKASARSMPHQTLASSRAVCGVCGRDAMNAAFSAPTDVPTSRSAVTPRS
jgi:hypothetical protein